VSDEPRNVRLVYDDGTVVPLEIVFDHWEGDGVKMFRATALARVPESGIVKMIADSLPPKTGIVLVIDRDPDEIQWDLGGREDTTGSL
jgi:hypothetical protein